MSKVKKVIGNILEQSVEAVKDVAGELNEALGPEALLKATLGEGAKPQPENEFSAYLKGLGNGLEGDALKAKQDQAQSEDEQKKAALRTYLQATPAHMRLPPKPPELRPYEKMIQEEEQKKQMQAQQKSSSLVIPTSKPARGGLGKGQKRPTSANMELKHDNKSG